ncbi:Uncharacterised protein [Clostridium tertium]|uniref:Uncharacterized protein n=1 Tax=Clostridium tertium TaxID=1559 RepID=A0A6N3GWT0_9CLOT
MITEDNQIILGVQENAHRHTDYRVFGVNINFIERALLEKFEF